MAEIVNMPRLGLNEDTSILGEWFVSENDSVAKGDALFSIETDKSSMDVYAETEGTVLKCFYEPYDVVPVMTPVCVIGQPGEDISNISPAKGAAETVEEAPVSVPAVPGGAGAAQKDFAASVPETAPQGFLSPRARQLAEVNGVKVTGILPSGAEGRIIEADIIHAMQAVPEKENKPTDFGIEQPDTGLSDRKGSRIEKIPTIRRTIAKNMMDSLRNTAQLTNHMTYNASSIQRYREWLKLAPGDEKNITITDMILFATAKTLAQFNYMNAHMLNDAEMEYFDDVYLGCAVDTERGLMVPTVPKAQTLSLVELSRKVKELAAKCRGGSILPEEMIGATFTVSNLGGLGVTDFTPILNPPQIGILGVGNIEYAVKKTNEGILYYPAGHLSLTYDHRAVDGAPASRFLQAVCKNLEQFEQLI
ncbi:dihydrolipoamide acetyltransferase family protein [Christensenella tenuis]|jgi:pyruvate dehydrogenase E2 component (dihydrolipoamide acetyltransferase)|uniref:Dihydrolipoamide acetyltransferase component of pyruvate dehydrogenase complex n=1 Tax=Christensenella tenuis TaxID=2763033 RepID=A0ABR7EJ83_9FIRM|nr:dihydrolipoamide acetyltransferase family protein [Christensenella tenuis]MBC5649204.1 2-oxo acid dehydrogenase subunit E2 [Christensenella tenuis]